MLAPDRFLVMFMEVEQIVADELKIYCFAELKKARETLTQRYRTKEKAKGRPFIQNDAQRIVYVLARFPATHAVVSHVFQYVNKDSIASLLDLGSGPGTALWAAHEAFPDLARAVMVEQDSELIGLGKRLEKHLRSLDTSWKQGDMRSLEEEEVYDLLTLSYSIGELPSEAVETLIKNCWQKTKNYLAIIEPGTPAGFERIRTIRSQLLTLGAYLVAPCPQAGECPMANGDWCHFSKRIERSSQHRLLKEGTLGYEDEKFSYLIVSKKPHTLPEARILRHPLKRSGHMILDLCTSKGLERKTISKRTPELYKKATKLTWGDPI